MITQEASRRYAKALFSLASERKRVEEILNEVREVSGAVQKEQEIRYFFSAPIVKKEEQRQILEKFFEKKNLSDEVKGLLLLLVEKRRFGLLPQIAEDFQSDVDRARDVARGQVRSATTLFPEDRQKLEQTISRHTGRKAVLEYHEDKGLLGGLVAQVGSFTFDDSLETQLRLMRDSLRKRRSN